MNSKMKTNKFIEKTKEFFNLDLNSCLAILLFVIIFLSVKISVFKYLAVALSFVFLFKPMYLLPNIFNVSMLSMYYPSIGPLSLSLLFVFEFILFYAVNVLLKKEKFPDLKIIITTIVITIFLLINGYFAFIPGFKYTLSMLLNIYMAIIIYTYITKEDINYVLNIMWIISLFMTLFILIKFLFDPVYYMSSRLFCLEKEINPNRVAIYLGALFMLQFEFFIFSKDKTKEILSLVMSLISYFLLDSTFSRTSIIAVIATISLVIIFNLFVKVITKKKTLAITFVLLALVLFTVLPSTNNFFYSRFKSATGEKKDNIYKSLSITKIKKQRSSGRVLIWENILTKVVPNNYLVGVGPHDENINLYLQSIEGKNNWRPHNIFFAVLGEFGVFASIAFFGMLIYLYINYVFFYKKDIIEFKVFIILSFIIICGIGESIIMIRSFYIMLAMGLALNRKYKTDEK